MPQCARIGRVLTTGRVNNVRNLYNYHGRAWCHGPALWGHGRPWHRGPGLWGHGRPWRAQHAGTAARRSPHTQRANTPLPARAARCEIRCATHTQKTKEELSVVFASVVAAPHAQRTEP